MDTCYAMPPIPNGWEKPVIRSIFTISPYLTYVMGQIMYCKRGELEYDRDTDHFIGYLRITPADREVHLTLQDIEEVWISFSPDIFNDGGIHA